MKTQAQIIQQTVKSLYMQGVCAKKGWSEQHAASRVVEFLTSKGVSLFEFMEQQPAATV